MGRAALRGTNQCFVNMLSASVSDLPCCKASYNKLKNILAVNLGYDYLIIASLVYITCTKCLIFKFWIQTLEHQHLLNVRENNCRRKLSGI